MTSGHMSRRRAFSASNDNRDNLSRYTFDKTPALARDTTSHCKPAHGNPPPRIFIKPREGASSQTNANANGNPKLVRRASLISVPTSQQQQRNTRRTCSLTSAKPTHAPRRSTSLHHTAINSMNTPASKLPRSSTLMRHESAKRVANRGVDGDVGHFIQSSECQKRDKTAVTKPTRASLTSSPKNNKENEPSAPLILTEKTSGKQHMSRRATFTRRQSPLVPDELRRDGSPPRKVFLLPKIDESVSKPAPPRRRSSARSAATRSEKKNEIAKMTCAPPLPTIVMRHTPTKVAPAQILFSEEESGTPAQSVRSGNHQAEASIPIPKPKAKARPFLLPRRAGSLASSTSLGSILSLPSQVLEHTPLGSQPSGSPSSSPCLSKARTKTIWTMLDEMKLIRSGGRLQHRDALAPESDVRVVPLCKRLRNGSSESGSPEDGISRKTPVRSLSTPYRLVVSSARHSRFELPNALPPVPSITRALAHARVGWEHRAVEDRLKTTTNSSEKYHPTPVDAKKTPSQQLQRRSTLGKPMISPGYGVNIATRNTMTPRKPSLLTRAQTLMKLRFSGSKRVVGRGDPTWT